jgi:hypothetical protein
MSKKKDEVITVKAVVNLNVVIFKPDFESGIYKMTLPTGWGFSIQTEVTEETKKEIERLIAEGINNNENKR